MLKIKDGELSRRIIEGLKSIGRDVCIGDDDEICILDGYPADRARRIMSHIKATKGKETVIREGDADIAVLIGGPGNAWLIPVGLSRHGNFNSAISKTKSGERRWNAKLQKILTERVEEAFEDNAPIMRAGTK